MKTKQSLTERKKSNQFHNFQIKTISRINEMRKNGCPLTHMFMCGGNGHISLRDFSFWAVQIVSPHFVSYTIQNFSRVSETVSTQNKKTPTSERKRESESERAEQSRAHTNLQCCEGSLCYAAEHNVISGYFRSVDELTKT